MTARRYQIQVNIAGDWEPGEWQDVDADMMASGREAVTYDTEAEARAELEDHLTAMEQAGMDYDPDDWRVSPEIPQI